MLPDVERLRAILTDAAEQELLPRFAHTGRGIKADGSVVTEADIAMQRRVGDALAHEWPQFRLLGEEMDEREQRTLMDEPGPGLWCLDPLDGTSNFAAGVPFFSVSLALLAQGEAVLGLVYDPLRRECFSAQAGQGARLNGVRLHARPVGVALKRAIAMIDFKRLKPDLAARLAQHPPYSSQRSFGSVALDWCWLAAGRCHVYFHGGQKLWDYAAGSLILKEAGGNAITLAGEPIQYSELQSRSVAAALDPALFQEWTRWLGIEA